MAPVRALVQRLGPHVEEIEPVVVRPGGRIDRDALVETLVAGGYRREYQVESRGEVAVRGSIVDVYPSTDDHPIRIDLWGDEVDRLSAFAVADQRSTHDVDEAWIFPTRELLPTPAVRERAAELLRTKRWGREQWERLADGQVFDGMESWLPWLAEREHLLPDLLPDTALTLLVEPKRMRDRAQELLDDEASLASTLAVTWNATDDEEFPRLSLDFDRLLAHTKAGAVSLLATPEGPDTPRVAATAFDPVVGDTDALARRLRSLVGEGYRVVLAAEGTGSSQRLRDVLATEGVDGIVELVVAPIGRGVVLPNAKLALVAEADLTGRRRVHRRARRAPRHRLLRRARTRRLRRPLRARCRPLHRDEAAHHGGRRARLPLAPVPRRHGVRAHRSGRARAQVHGWRVAVAQPDGWRRLREAAGAGAQRGAGDRRGARRALPAAARDARARLPARHALAARGGGGVPLRGDARPAPRHRRGEGRHGAADPDGSPRVRRRRLRQDRGRVRAAFKAVQDGKQVAVLVPTTLLASQHGQTFRERFANYPVRVEVLSRFLSPKEQAAVARDLEAGSVDVVIGTHRLLSDDVKVPNLGLLVVDEEQRFGVQHKERIKQMRANVDVLTLTATPIPRTLELSLTGIRDLSLVNTPPEDRQPILTYVGEYDDRAAAEAIRRELLREGQVFYVHNRVRDIELVAENVRALVPEARVAVAHGQMDESRLERVVQDFWEREYDVLVCTTIVESGLDMPTVNTLVVDRADLLGLAQLYQLRGRVGRRGQRAYAYLLHPPDRVLSEEAYERLKTIGEFTDLGSGLQDRDARPRDPRRGQPARRGAVRAHRGRRLRPLLPDGHRSRRRAQGRAGPRTGRDHHRRPRRRQPAPRLRRVTTCAWRRTGGSPRSPTPPTSTTSAPNGRTGTGRPRLPPSRCSTWRACARVCAPRHPRRHRAAQHGTHHRAGTARVAEGATPPVGAEGGGQGRR